MERRPLLNLNPSTLRSRMKKARAFNGALRQFRRSAICRGAAPFAARGTPKSLNPWNHCDPGRGLCLALTPVMIRITVVPP